MKKILLLADANNIHAQQWAKAFYRLGQEVHIWSLKEINYSYYDDAQEIKLYQFNDSDLAKSIEKADMEAVGNSPAIDHLNNTIDAIQPDIIHAHKGLPYGLMGLLCKRPYHLNATAYDVITYPYKGTTHKFFIKKILNGAAALYASNKYLQDATAKLTKHTVNHQPVGVDLEKFKSITPPFQREKVTIGTIKKLETEYGVDILIKSFKKVLDEYEGDNLELMIVGDGSQKEKLIDLASTLGISDKVVFNGGIDHEMTPRVFNLMDLPVFLSRSETFGVSAMEAMACGRPIVVSSAAGLKEITDGTDNPVVKHEDTNQAKDVIIKILTNRDIYKNLGDSNRVHAEHHFDWNKMVSKQLIMYDLKLAESSSAE
jgi:glycosyltransferase involved in cell wall biosynthesis